MTTHAQVLNLNEAGTKMLHGEGGAIVMPKAEVFNAIIEKVWPSLEAYIEKLLFEDISKAAAERLEGFAFEKLDFGSEPPTLSNFKFYNGANIEADEVVMDVDLVYAGNMAVSAVWKKIRFGLRNVRFAASLRLRLAPLLCKPPFFGCASVATLAVPTVDFDATGFANIVDFKPIYSTLQSLINEKLTSSLVVPNALVVSLSAKNKNEDGDLALTEFRCRVPRGVLQVLAIEASELASHDLLSKSDPFLRVRLGADEQRTRTVENSSQPQWNESLEFDVRESAGALLSLEVFDEDSTSSADLIGRCTTFDFRDTVARVADGGILEDLLVVGPASWSSEPLRFDSKWYTLSDTKDGKGRVRLGFRYFDFVEDPDMLRTAGRPVNTVVCVYVHSASLLSDAKATSRVTIALRPSEACANAPECNTVFKQDTNQPEWNTFFKWLLPTTLHSSDCDSLKHNLLFTVRNSAGSLLGETSVLLSDVLRSRRFRIEDRAYELSSHGSGTGSLRVTVALRYVAAYRDVDFAKLTCASTANTVAPLPSLPIAPLEDGVGEFRIGRVRLSFSYDSESRTANVVLLKCSNLAQLEDKSKVRVRIIVRLLPAGRQCRRSRVLTGFNPVVNEMLTFDLSPDEVNESSFCVAVRHCSCALSIRRLCANVRDLLGETSHVSLAEIREVMQKGAPSLTRWFDLTPISCDRTDSH